MIHFLGKWGLQLVSSSHRLNLTSIVIILVSLWALVFLTGMIGPPTIYDNDQQRPTAYVLDVLVNHQWIVQEDHTYDISSKPPLYTWCASLWGVIFGGVNEFTMYITSALSVLGTAFLILYSGEKAFTRWAGFWGAVMWLLSSVAFKHTVLARTDALFGFLTFLLVVLVLHCIQTGRGWLWVYVVAALSTLTKGPLGIVLFLGMVPVFLIHSIRFKNSEENALSYGKWRTHVIGLVFFLVLCGGWFLLSYMEVGHRLFDKMISKELVGHALQVDEGHVGLASHLSIPSLYFLSRMFPWSIFALLGAGRFLVNRQKHPERMLMARALLCYFFVGIVIFSFGAHKRADHLVPLIPAAMVFAGWELSRWYRPEFTRRWFRNACLACLGLFLVIFSYSQVISRRKDRVQKSIQAKEFAQHIESQVGSNFPIIPVDMYSCVQFYQGTFRHQVSPEVAKLALESNAAAFVGVRNFLDMEGVDLSQYHVLYEVAVVQEEPFLQIISNREELKPEDHMIMAANGLLIEMMNLKVVSPGDRFVQFESIDRSGFLKVSNPTKEKRELTVQINGRKPQRVILESGKSERIDL
jgi:Dolichyl-phosphate-mannose-protein mannosyltransferase